MNKQEAIEKIKNIDTLNIKDNIAGQSVDMVIKNEVLDIISQIDEPVEKEKLYTVEIPDPHGIYKIRYLFRNSVGNIRIGGSDYRDIFSTTETHLTESEIKKDFEWAWQWAKEVEATND